MHEPILPTELRLVITQENGLFGSKYKWQVQGRGKRYSFYDDEEVDGWWPYEVWHDDIFTAQKAGEGRARTLVKAEAKGRAAAERACENIKARAVEYSRWNQGRIVIPIDCDCAN